MDADAPGSRSSAGTGVQTLLLCIVGLFLPNALAICTLLAGIGTPPRSAAIAAYAVVALSARVLPFELTVVGFLAVAAYDIVATISLMFGLAPQEIVRALNLVSELRLLESSLYRWLFAGAIALLAVNLAGLRFAGPRMRHGSMLVLTGLAFAYGAVDLAANTSAHCHFGSVYGSTEPVESAADASGFREALTEGPKRHALLVVVEALGRFKDPDKQALLLAPFRDPALRNRYAVTAGSSTYFGSTTAAEMRELCDSREPYAAVLEEKVHGCLPARMAAQGYRTAAFHNFKRTFFERGAWYPIIGFDKVAFAKSLDVETTRRCGGAFKGICDVDVIPVIARRLREAQAPSFLYWLTLSTHVPVVPGEGTPRLGCLDGGPIGHAEVCYMTELWLDVMHGLAAMTADVPPTEILIVGDHAPPLWSRAGRALFTPGKVTWIRLRPLSPAEAPTAAAGAD